MHKKSCIFCSFYSYIRKSYNKRILILLKVKNIIMLYLCFRYLVSLALYTRAIIESEELLEMTTDLQLS